jgi:hypothetical protein
MTCLKRPKLILSCCEAKLYENENCRCKYILLIQHYIKKYMTTLNNLPIFEYNKIILSYPTINSFLISEKKTNDQNNKIRENIIGAIINDKIPQEYYCSSNKWKHMKNNILDYINCLAKENITDNITIDKIICNHKGGRTSNFDFIITINDKYSFNIELKFNASTISEAPQFVSPMKPSQYLSSSYEEYYYDNYISILAECGKLIIPPKEEYLSQIHSPNPKCMNTYQEKYYFGSKGSSKYTDKDEDINFYLKAKKLSAESIVNFIKNTELNIEELSKYLKETQENKHYMMYKNNRFYKQNVNMDDYELVSYEKQKNRFVATSKTENKIKILLRWKNGNGIAFPAFQIS